MSEKQGPGRRPWWRRSTSDVGDPSSDREGTEPGWTTSADGASRIYLDLVRVACPPAAGGWVDRLLGGERDVRDGLVPPVHGWLRRGDEAVRSVLRSDRTLCGLRLDDLRWRELDHVGWVEVQPTMRCRICAVVLEQ